MKITKVALIGAGAVGAYFVWGLSEKLGDDFCVIADEERKKRLEQKGIVINGKRYFPHVARAEEADKPDLILVCTKYDALDGAIEDMKKLVKPETVVISLLNGVDSEERIGEEIGEEHLLYSVMRIASVRNEEGIVFSPERTAGVYFGEKDSEAPTERVKAVEELFDIGGIRHVFVENIMADIWNKYASNISQNLPQAIIGVGCGAYQDSEHAFFIAARLWEEVALVARARGIVIPAKIMLFRGVKKDARFSTFQDIDAKRHTEIEMFAGEMIRMGREAGIPVPYCEYTYHAIRAIEERNDGKFDYGVSERV